MKAGCRFRLIAPLVLLSLGCTVPTGPDPEPLTRVDAAWVTGDERRRSGCRVRRAHGRRGLSDCGH